MQGKNDPRHGPSLVCVVASRYYLRNIGGGSVKGSRSWGCGILLLCACSGCGPSHLITEDQFSVLHYRDTEDSRTVFFTKTFRVTDDAHLLISTHRIVRAGTKRSAMPHALSVVDGGVYRLSAFEGRVTHKRGGTETYSSGDLSSTALATKHFVTESVYKSLPIERLISSGDLVETYSEHETALGPLGIEFSPEEAGDADNIVCRIEVPEGRQLHYRVYNDSLSPSVSVLDGTRTYEFHWPTYVAVRGTRVFGNANPEPLILASVPAGTDTGWIGFGDWCLNLIRNKLQPDDRIRQKAEEVTRGMQTPREKMDAILSYCQSAVRYEQIYLDQGEFIPNAAPLVLQRKYGDCKDYATLIYSMAHSVGVDAHLVLCYRGRGVEFHDDVPVSQFNHMIACYTDSGTTYWYDGTNRSGIPGVTTFDLANATALILQEHGSHLERIPESAGNLLSITGVLRATGRSLTGRIAVGCRSQFAIDFQYLALFLSNERMTQELDSWLHTTVNPQMITHDLGWEGRDGEFIIEADVELPNSITSVGGFDYIALSRSFGGLLPGTSPEGERPFYYPSYNRVHLALMLDNLRDPADSATAQGFQWKADYFLPAGPFRRPQVDEFVRSYSEVRESFEQKRKLYRVEGK